MSDELQDNRGGIQTGDTVDEGAPLCMPGLWPPDYSIYLL